MAAVQQFFVNIKKKSTSKLHVAIKVLIPHTICNISAIPIPSNHADTISQCLQVEVKSRITGWRECTWYLSTKNYLSCSLENAAAWHVLIDYILMTVFFTRQIHGMIRKFDHCWKMGCCAKKSPCNKDDKAYVGSSYLVVWFWQIFLSTGLTSNFMKGL